VRAPLIVHWPARVGGAATGVRPQFHHAIDVLPTLLDLAGAQAPAAYRGVQQLPIHGTSMTYSFDDPHAPGTRTRQYFETAGNRAIVEDGWKAVAAHRSGSDFDADRWELYDLTSDVAETVDRAHRDPARLERLVAGWWAEAERFGVLPLDDRMGARVAALDPATDRRRYTMLPGTRILNHVVGPSFRERGFRVSARLRGGAHDRGVILAYGRRAFGFSFFLSDRRLTVDYNLAGRHTILAAEEDLPDVEVTAEMRVEPAPEGATLAIAIDGRRVGATAVPRLVPGGIGTLSIQCGHNAPSPVSDAYEAPFTFTGFLGPVDIELDQRRDATAEAEAQAEMAFQ
jgi:arylsulfatase